MFGFCVPFRLYIFNIQRFKSELHATPSSYTEQKQCKFQIYVLFSLLLLFLRWEHNSSSTRRAESFFDVMNKRTYSHPQATQPDKRRQWWKTPFDLVYKEVWKVIWVPTILNISQTTKLCWLQNLNNVISSALHASAHGVFFSLLFNCWVSLERFFCPYRRTHHLSISLREQHNHAVKKKNMKKNFFFPLLYSGSSNTLSPARFSVNRALFS